MKQYLQLYILKINMFQFSTQQVNGLLGTSIQTNEIAEIFDSLKFKYELKEDTFNVKIPTIVMILRWQLI